MWSEQNKTKAICIRRESSYIFNKLEIFNFFFYYRAFTNIYITLKIFFLLLECLTIHKNKYTRNNYYLLKLRNIKAFINICNKETNKINRNSCHHLVKHCNKGI